MFVKFFKNLLYLPKKYGIQGGTLYVPTLLLYIIILNRTSHHFKIK